MLSRLLVNRLAAANSTAAKRVLLHGHHGLRALATQTPFLGMPVKTIDVRRKRKGVAEIYGRVTY